MNAKVITRFFASQNEFPQPHVVYSEEKKPLNSSQFPFFERGERKKIGHELKKTFAYVGREGGKKRHFASQWKKNERKKTVFFFWPAIPKKYVLPYLITTLSVKLGMFLFPEKVTTCHCSPQKMLFKMCLFSSSPAGASSTSGLASSPTSGTSDRATPRWGSPALGSCSSSG